jgi:predicted transcriptional regulator
MSATPLEIRSDLMILDHLVNEALSLSLVQQRRITARIQEGLAQAKRGEFVTDEEMEAYFACFSETKAFNFVPPRESR